MINTGIVYAAGIDGVTVSGGQITIDTTQAGTTTEVTTLSDMFNEIFSVLKYLITGATGCLAILSVGVFCFKSFKLTSADNPKERQEAIQGMLYACIGTGLLGSASLLSGLAFGLFSR